MLSGLEKHGFVSLALSFFAAGKQEWPLFPMVLPEKNVCLFIEGLWFKKTFIPLFGNIFPIKTQVKIYL